MSGALSPGGRPLGDASRVRTSDELAADIAMHAWRRGEATAADPGESRRWLERARRIAPSDAMVALSLALACLRDDDPAAAARLFAEVCNRYEVAEAWMGLAASALRLGEHARAAEAMQACLSRHAVNDTTRGLAAAVAAAAGLPGWCALDPAGRCHADAPADLVLDGAPLRPRWSGASCRVGPGAVLAVTRAGVPLLGSPIDLAAIGATEGFVEATAGVLSGWAWHPGDPARDPVITIAGATEYRVTARQVLDNAAGGRPLARPRRFQVAAADLPPGLLRVTGPDGRDLLGSPLDPAAERRSAAGLEAGFQPVWADVIGPAPATSPRAPRPVDVVVPVYGGRAQTLACLDSVLASLPRGSRLHVVDDASPDPMLAAALDALARRGRIRLLRLPRNRGFPAAANAGIAAATRRDVILLNSDTLVPPGWLEALAAAARSAPGIATACPLSNEATILSYPKSGGGNPMPDLAGTIERAALARQANGAIVVDIPVAVGFCMFIRRDCLDQIGSFREDLFAQGYGEENDFCLRARHHGWRHVAVPGVFVAHQGGASFRTAQTHLQRRNAAVLNRLHPGYDALIAAWLGEDPLSPARQRMDALRWKAGRLPRSAILVTHIGGGGVDRVIETRAAALREAGSRPIILRPGVGCVVVGDGDTPNLRFPMPAGLGSLATLLRAARPTHVELHHVMGHDPAILDLAGRLGLPHDVHWHDYAWFCPRIALVPEHAYCGEPPLSGCQACIADHGSNLDEDIPVAALVTRSAAMLGAARRVVAPAADVAGRIQRHFPGVRPEVMPWEDDLAIPPPPVPGRIRHVCVIGGIGVEKGFEILLACVRDAARRQLPLWFTVVGHTADDERLLAAGPVFVTGTYAESEAQTLIRAQAADVAFIPSIWPETWCFTLSHAWRAGLQAAVFDIGTPAERVRRTGWGWVLPLGLPPASVNDWLLRAGPKPHQTSRSVTNGLQSQVAPSPIPRNAVI
jgi:GT2 family glycosyltransferase